MFLKTWINKKILCLIDNNLIQYFYAYCSKNKSVNIIKQIQSCMKI